MITLAVFAWLFASYLVCFLLGLGYWVIAGVFGAFGGGDAGGGHDVGVGHDVGADIGHGADLGGGHDVVAGHDVTAADVGGHIPGDISTEPAISPFSPQVISMILISFGATGIVCHEMLGMRELSLLPSGAAGIVFGVGTYLLFYLVIRKLQGSSSPTMDEVVGLEAEATTPIPYETVGEIAYIVRGTRFTARAKSTAPETIPNHAAVKIVKWVGNTAYVSRVG